MQLICEILINGRESCKVQSLASVQMSTQKFRGLIQTVQVLEQQMQFCKRSLKKKSPGSRAALGPLQWFLQMLRPQTINTPKTLFLSFICSAHLLLAQSQVSELFFLGWGGTGSKSRWEISGCLCFPVMLPLDTHTFSTHLGTVRKTVYPSQGCRCSYLLIPGKLTPLFRSPRMGSAW